MAAILDFANMVAPWGARLGARQKSKQYNMDDLWAKVGAFRRIWTNISLTPLTKPNTSVYNIANNTFYVYLRDCSIARVGNG